MKLDRLSDAVTSRLLDRRPRLSSTRTRATALAAVGASASVGFGVMAVASARRVTTSADNRVHGKLQRGRKGPVRKAAKAAAPAIEKAGKWWIYTPVALAAAAAVLAAPGTTSRVVRTRRVGAAAIALVPALATLLSPAFDRWLPQPPVGPRRRPVDHPVFPSGHGFRSAAVALTTGYVVAREGLAPTAVAWSLAGATPVIVGLARMVREKHLASDTLGGWLAGTALAAAMAGTYELTREPRRGPALRRLGG